MLRRFILHLRHKPKHKRDTFALGAASLFTAVIVLVWVWHWPSMIAERQVDDSEKSAPLSDFIDRASEQVAAARETVDLDALKEVTQDESVDGGIDVQSAIDNGFIPATTSVQLPIRIATTSTSTLVSTTSTSNVIY